MKKHLLLSFIALLCISSVEASAISCEQSRERMSANTSLVDTRSDKNTQGIVSNQGLPIDSKKAAVGKKQLTRASQAARSTVATLADTAAVNETSYVIPSLPYTLTTPLTQWVIDDVWGSYNCVNFYPDTNTIQSFAMEYQFNGIHVSSYGFDCTNPLHYMFYGAHNSSYTPFVSDWQLIDRWQHMLMIQSDGVDYSDFSLTLTEPTPTRSVNYTDYLDEVRTGSTVYTLSSATDSIIVPWNIVPAQPTIADYLELPTYYDQSVEQVVSAHAHRIIVPAIASGNKVKISGMIQDATNSNYMLRYSDYDELNYLTFKYENGEYVYTDNILDAGGEYIILQVGTVSLATAGYMTIKFKFEEITPTTTADLFGSLPYSDLTTETLTFDDNASLYNWEGAWYQPYYLQLYKFDLSPNGTARDYLFYLLNETNPDAAIGIRLYGYNYTTDTYTQIPINAEYYSVVPSRTLLTQYDDLCVVLYSQSNTVFNNICIDFLDAYRPNTAGYSWEEVISHATQVSLPHEADYDLRNDGMIHNNGNQLMYVKALKFDIDTTVARLNLTITESKDPLLDTYINQHYEIYRFNPSTGTMDEYVCGGYAPYTTQNLIEITNPGIYYMFIWDDESYGYTTTSINIKTLPKIPTDNALTWDALVLAAEEVSLPYSATRPLGNKIHINDNGQTYYVDAFYFDVTETQLFGIHGIPEYDAFAFLMKQINGSQMTTIIDNSSVIKEYIQLDTGRYYFFVFDTSLDPTNRYEFEIKPLIDLYQLFDQRRTAAQYNALAGYHTITELTPVIYYGWVYDADIRVFNIEEETTISVTYNECSAVNWFKYDNVDDTYIPINNCDTKMTLDPGIYCMFMMQNPGWETPSAAVEIQHLGTAYSLYIEEYNSGSVTVSSDNTVNADGTYPAGTTITLTAQAADGYTFDSWGETYNFIDGTSDTSNPRTITLDSNMSVYPYFAPIGYDCMDTYELLDKAQSITLDYSHTNRAVNTRHIVAPWNDGAFDVFTFTLADETSVTFTATTHSSTADCDEHIIYMEIMSEDEESFYKGMCLSDTHRAILPAGKYYVSIVAAPQEEWSSTYDMSITTGDFSEVATIREFIDAAITTRPLTITGPLTVTYANGKYTYVRDDHGSSLLIYSTLTQVLQPGDIINGVTGTYYLFGNLPEMTNATLTSVTTGTAVPEPEEMNYDDNIITPSDRHLSDYVILRGRTVRHAFNNLYMYIDSQGWSSDSLTIYDKFKLFENNTTFAEGDRIDIVGLVSEYKGIGQIYPVSIIPSPQYTVTTTLGQGGEVRYHGSVNITYGTPGIFTTPFYSGENIEINVRANAGYQIDDLKIDGESTPEYNYYDNRTEVFRYLHITANTAVDITFRPMSGEYRLTTSVNDTEMGYIDTWGDTLDNNGLYLAGATVYLEAIPNTGYRFVEWSDGNTNAMRTLTMTKDITLTATFEPIEYIYVTFLAGTGGTITPSGTVEYIQGSSVSCTINADNGYTIESITIEGVQLNGDYQGQIQFELTIAEVFDNCTIAVTFSQATTYYTFTATVNDEEMGAVAINNPSPDNRYAAGTELVITAQPTQRHRFVQWSDGNTNATRTITVNSDMTLEAQFEAEEVYYSLRWHVSNAAMGTVQVNPAANIDGKYPANTQVTLTAVPNSGYEFVNWSSDTHIPDNPLIIIMTGDVEVTANFREQNTSSNDVYATYVVSEGGYTSPTGIVKYQKNVDFSFWAHAEYKYTIDSVIINGVAYGNTDYIGMTDYNFTTSISADCEINVVFHKNYYTLTTSVNDNAMGRIDITGAAAEQDGTYREGSVVTLTAVPNSGYEFVTWSDGNTNPSRTETINSDITLSAIFRQISTPVNYYTLTTSVNDDAMGRIDITGATAEQDGTYREGSVVTLTAVPNSGYEFVSWNDGNTNPSRTETINSDITLSAIFRTTTTTMVEIEITAGSQGIVLPIGKQTVAAGASVDIVIAASDGWVVKEITINNVRQTASVIGKAAGKYTYKNATDGDVIHVAFKEKPSIQYYTISAMAEYDYMGTVSIRQISGDTQNGKYSAGSELEITATPAAGYNFANWDDGDKNATRTIIVSYDMTLTAIFKQIKTYTLTTSVNNGNLGTITTEGGNPISSGRYYEGSVVTVIARPAFEANFIGWENGDTARTRTVTMNNNITVTATFERKELYTVAVTSIDETMGVVTVTGDAPLYSNQYEKGAHIIITATAKQNYRFDRWSDGDENPVRDIYVSEDVIITALFVPDNTPTTEVSTTPLRAYITDMMLYIESDDTTSPVTITHISGSIVYQGYDRQIRLPQRGTYIISLGNQRLKIVDNQ